MAYDDDYNDEDPLQQIGGDPIVGGGASATPPPVGTSPFAYGGKATQALIDAIYGSGYSLGNGQINYGGQGDPFWKQAGQENAGYLNSLADPLAGKDYRKFFETLYGGSNATQYNLTNSAQNGVLKAGGFNISPANQQGQISKIQTPDGRWVRVIEGDPKAGGSWTWVDQGAGGTGPGAGSPGGYGFGVDPSYLSPWDKDFSFPDFEAPNEADLKSDPSFLWRRNNAVGAYQNSSAAKGLLNSSNSGYDIGTLADALAAQEYGNVFSRKFGTWQAGRNNAWQQFQNQQETHYRNQNEPFDKLFKGGTLGLDANS